MTQPAQVLPSGGHSNDYNEQHLNNCGCTKDKLDLLRSIQAILEVADADLSWDTLPNRGRIQSALKFTNTLITIESK